MAFFISGGVPLRGSVTAQGAKNAALPMLFAGLLCREPVTLYGVPDIGDVRVALSLLSAFGVEIRWQEDGALTLSAEGAEPASAPLSEAEKIRASAYLLGAALSRFGEVSVPVPGGCAFGARPLDYHRAGFTALGASWEEKDGVITLKGQKRRGAFFALPYPSVGATVNFILGALGAEGESTLYGYAREHHVMDFIAFLRKMGASIYAEGDFLHIEGGKPLGGGTHTVIPDSVEAGTYLIAAAVCGGEVTVERVRYAELSPLLLAFGRMNVPFRFSGNAVTVYQPRRIQGVHITAAPYPGFPTDLHPPMTVLFSRAAGGGSLCDLVWQDRFSYVEELKKMGLCAYRSPHAVHVAEGRLHGASVRAPDLRGGAALIVAALSAEENTRIEGEDCIARGYQDLPKKLFSLGADISLV